MKKSIYKIVNLVLMCMLITITACTDSIVPSVGVVPGDGTKEIPVVLDINGLFNSNITTYGTTYPYPPDLVNGTAAENLIDNIVVYIFDNTYACEKIRYYSSGTVPVPIGPVMVKSGIKHIVVVANGDGKLLLEKVNEASVHYATLLQQITNLSATLPHSPFLMTGIKNNIILPDELPSSAPYTEMLEIKRACAKITMQITKSLNAQSHNITVKQVTLIRGADRVALFNPPSPNPTLYNITEFSSAFTPTDVLSNDPIYIALADTFYTYESLCGADTTKAVRFEIVSEVNSPSNLRTAKFFLATFEQPLGDSTYNIYRNHWYDIRVNIVDPGMDSVYVVIKTCPWNVAEPIDTTVGKSAEFLLPASLKLVKYITDNEFSNTSNRPYTAITKHSKGASWIAAKVTNNTQWTIGVKNNEPYNTGVWASIDKVNWTELQYPFQTFSGIGNDDWDTIYIYRPYRENAEPSQGPSLYFSLDGVYKRDFIIQPRDSLQLPTNSYVMRPQLSGAPTNETRAYIPLAGVYTHWEDYLLANGDTIPAGTIYADVMWKDTTGAVIKNWQVINANKRDSAYIVAEAGVPGNAVIGMFINDGSSPMPLYWSFHLWVTEYNPYEAAGQKFGNTGIPDGSRKNVFMDRNLGALLNEYSDNGWARGLLYQFGRKDPLPSGQNWNNTFKWFTASNTPISSITTWPVPAASGLFRPRQAIPNSIFNPMVFYKREGAPIPDWTFTLEDPCLWDTNGGNKTAYDPCPEGWRIPQNSTGTAYPWSGDITLVNNNTVTGKGFTNSMLGFIPLSGHINPPTPLTNATISSADSVGIETFLWTSYSDISLIFPNIGSVVKWYHNSSMPTNHTSIGTMSLDKSHAISVRCVVDKQYIIKKENGGLFGSEAGKIKTLLGL